MSFVGHRALTLTRARVTPLRDAFLVFRGGARRANSSHAGSHKPKSDTPWIIGSALIFGPAFLYLISPSARKNTHFVHNDKHDFPAQQTHIPRHEPEPEPATTPASSPEPETEATLASTPEQTGSSVMKDDEGTESDISESLKASADDVPKAATSAGEKQDTSVEKSSSETPTEPEAEESAGDGANQKTESRDGNDVAEVQKETKEAEKFKKKEETS